MMTFPSQQKIYLVEQPMIITHGGKLNVTSTIKLVTVIDYWLYVIILEIPPLYKNRYLTSLTPLSIGCRLRQFEG